MSSSNHRSSSNSHSFRCVTTDGQIQTSRSSNVPNRQFIIILTNNPDMVRRTTAFRPDIGEQLQTTSHTGMINNNPNQIHREQLLNNLLQIELSEVIQNYLSRTRRSFPVHYVFDMSDIDIQPQQLGYQ